MVTHPSPNPLSRTISNLFNAVLPYGSILSLPAYYREYRISNSLSSVEGLLSTQCDQSLFN